MLARSGSVSPEKEQFKKSGKVGLLEDKVKQCENKDKSQVRRSERIKKRLKDIDPEDIGENDDKNDKNYRGWGIYTRQEKKKP